MTIFQAIIMGLVQGLGEFLPISSSAHLVLVPWLFNWPTEIFQGQNGLTLDIALHIGTLVAVVAYFWRDWLKLVLGGLRGWKNPEGRIFWFLVAASIPGAAIGLLLESKAETVFRTPLLIGIMLIVMGIILYWADRRSSQNEGIDDISFKTSFLIGLSQALAIIPGVSRSGITMSTALFAGLKREAAARFSFLLSTPIILGAGLLKLPKIIGGNQSLDVSFYVAMAVSAITGFIAIGFLLKYVQTKTFRPFSYYRFVVGAIVIGVALMRG
ncbi:MAG: undecaprenyl-diphosphate phosphatase [Acidobacteriota bacterium]